MVPGLVTRHQVKRKRKYKRKIKKDGEMPSACQGTSVIIAAAWRGLRLPSLRTSIGQSSETGSIPLLATTETIINGADAAPFAGLGSSLNFPITFHYLRLGQVNHPCLHLSAEQVAQKEKVWKGKWVGTQMGTPGGKEDSPGFPRRDVVGWSPGTGYLREAMAATEVLRIVSEVDRVSGEVGFSKANLKHPGSFPSTLASGWSRS